MHLIHLGDALGFLFAPAVATQVLSSGKGQPGWEPLPGLQGVRAYFPMLGSLVLLCTPCYLYYCMSSPAEADDEEKKALNTGRGSLSWLHWTLVAIFNVIEVLLASTWAVGQQLPLYASKSHLHLPPAAGSSLNLLFWACNVGSRVVATLLASWIRASKAVYVSLVLYVAPSVHIVTRGAALTLVELRACVAILGVSSGPIYSFTLLIFEDIVHITPRISGLIYFGIVLGFKLYPMVIGFFIEEHPSSMFIAGILTGLASVFYACLSIFKARIKRLIQDA